MSPTTISDHCLIFAVRKFNCRRGPPRFIEMRIFKNFNKSKFIHDVKNADWPTPKSSDDINHA